MPLVPFLSWPVVVALVSLPCRGGEGLVAAGVDGIHHPTI